MSEVFTQQDARDLLEINSRSDAEGNVWTIPSSPHYPHQWLWDSGFSAVGWAESNPDRAMAEINSLLNGQWENGMIPNKLYSPIETPAAEKPLHYLENYRNIFKRQDRKTSAYTQPPVIATAVRSIAEKIDNTFTRDEFLRETFPKIQKFHEWLYEERDRIGNGVVTISHPYEAGSDNAPQLEEALYEARLPASDLLMSVNGLVKAISNLRTDTDLASAYERTSNETGIRSFELSFNHRCQRSREKSISKNFAVNNVMFNSILIRANDDLAWIADQIDEDLSPRIKTALGSAKDTLAYFWDDETDAFYDRNHLTQRFIKHETISSLFPIINSDHLTDYQIDAIVEHSLANPDKFDAQYPVPTVSMDSDQFEAQRFWKGPSWLNTNWYLVNGLEAVHDVEAERIALRSIDMVRAAGSFEYFDPNTGDGIGIDKFSWTSAVYLDLADRY